jgi:nicotinamidase-related amidase
MRGKHSRRLRKAESALLVIDIQERLLPAIFERERVVQNAVRLIKGAAILGIPIFATEQYRKGLGATVSEVAAALGEVAPAEKLAFSACGAADLSAALKGRKITSVILCGIESHVCVCQTSLDLLDANYCVFVVADAVSSRTPENHRIGLERMRDSGAVIASTEMVLFELLEKARTEEFKSILPLVK